MIMQMIAMRYKKKKKCHLGVVKATSEGKLIKVSAQKKKSLLLPPNEQLDDEYSKNAA